MSLTIRDSELRADDGTAIGAVVGVFMALLAAFAVFRESVRVRFVTVRSSVVEQYKTDKEAVKYAASRALSEDDPVAALHAGGKGYQTVAGNSIANYAIGLLVALIVLLVAALVGGEFAASIPNDSPFSDAINTTTDTAGTAFTIFGVTLIVLPGVAAVVLIVRGMGGVMGR